MRPGELLILAGLVGLAGAEGSLPALMSRASDSLSHLLGSRQQPQPLPVPSPSPSLAPAQAAAQPGQQVPPAPPQAAVPAAQPAAAQPAAALTPSPLPIHLQRLNGLVLSGANQLAQANLSAGLGGAAKYGTNMLEVLSNVGKAIQQQIQGQPGQQGGPAAAPVQQADQQQQQQQQQPNLLNATQIQQQQHYREQGEVLRQEILRRAGQLQQVVASSMEMMKSNGDLIVRRLLEQLSHRLDQAKSKADRIVLESPATNEVAIRALTTINLGLNNVNNIVTNIVARLEQGAREAQAQQALQTGAASANAQQRAGGSGAGPSSAVAPSALLLDPARLRSSLEQLKQQFSAAVQAAQQQRQANRYNK